MVAKLWLDPVVLQEAGGFGREELGVLVTLVHANRERLLEVWHEFLGD